MQDDRGSEPKPETAGEALERARTHARSAAAETLASLHALLDAAALAASGQPSEFHGLLGPLAKLLEGLAERLGHQGEPVGAPILEAVTEALDAEIARWEDRAREDPESRAVLRAFLGLRELLWEFGVRRGGQNGGGPGDEAEPSAAGPRARRTVRNHRQPRVQRVPIEG
jgi:hypothetical protein